VVGGKAKGLEENKASADLEAVGRAGKGPIKLAGIFNPGRGMIWSQSPRKGSAQYVEEVKEKGGRKLHANLINCA